MTPNQRHNRRMMIQLLVMGAAIMALSVGEKMRSERDAQESQEEASTPRTPKTYVPGARAILPSSSAQEEQEDAGSSHLQVVSAVEFQSWLDDLVAEDWDTSVSDCLYSWWLLDQGIEGEVGFEFVIDARGLQETAVLHHQGIPAGPAACLSKAMAQQSWPSTSGEKVIAVKNWRFSSSGESGIVDEESFQTKEGEENGLRGGDESENESND